jgi:hypothetical protein
MRLKGINVFEQHLEKVVAGIFALALLGVLALQFLTGPTTVKVGTNDVQIADAYAKIAAQAQTTDAQMHNAPQVPAPADVDKLFKPIEGFQESLTKSVAPNPQLAASLDKAPAYPWKQGGGNQGPTDASFAEVAFPAPTHAMAAPNMSTVATFEASVPEVAKILPPAQPYDKASVTVEAVVSGPDIKKALEADPDGDGPIRALPRNWWEGGTYILAVELHRQTLKPDGTWSAPEKVPGMPGRAVLVDKLDQLNDAESLKNAAKLATDQAELVRRTPYYDVSIGDRWIAPGDRAAEEAKGIDKAERIKFLKGDVKLKDAVIKTLTEQISKIGSTPSGPGGGGGGGGRQGGGRGGGPAAPPSSAPPSTAPSSDEVKRKVLQKKLDQAKEDRAKDIAELRSLGEKVEGEPDQPVQTDQTPKTAKGEPALLDNPSVRIWAHDVFVERGKTYRYQISVALTNPYFGHSAAMIPAQAEKLAKSGIMRSAPSEWTDPVTVDRETYVFFTSATEDEPVNGANAKARAEIFQFKWGYWRRGAGELEPGDRVAAEIKMPDYSKIMQAAAPNAPAQPAGPGPGGGPGGRGRAPGGDGGGGGGAPNPTATPPAEVPRVTVDVATKELVVGVGHGPGKPPSPKASEVFVREDDGQVRIIQPDAEKADSVYIRVNKSAERGEKELNPPVEKAKPTPGPNQTNPDRDGRGMPPPGGGGG